MFSRVLYVDDEVTMHLDWLGMGALFVIDGAGSKRKAHPAQKLVLHNVMRALNGMGVQINPANPACFVALRNIARALWEHSPSSLVWQTMYGVDPRELAAGAVRDGFDLMQSMKGGGE